MDGGGGVEEDDACLHLDGSDKSDVCGLKITRSCGSHTATVREHDIDIHNPPHHSFVQLFVCPSISHS